MPEYLQIPQTPRAKTRFDDGISDNHGGISLHELGNGGLPKDASLLDLDALRSLTVSPFSELSYGRTPSPAGFIMSGQPRHGPLTETWGSSWKRFWGRNRGVILVASSQLFGALMNLAARLLELEGEGMHPFQILFARMALTTIFSVLYMWWTKVPHWPLGPKGVRLLLFARGVTGFFGIFGMWYSMMYLPLAEATVITFLAPGVAGYFCHIILKDPFTRKEQLATLVALVGVVLIARPTSLFSGLGSAAEESVTAPTTSVETPGNLTATIPRMGEEATPTQRLWAIGVALAGVLGAAGAYTTIRWIGKRAHPLLSVTYFSVWCTLVSIAVLTLFPLLDIGQPAIRFGLPVGLRQWFLLVSLGVTGFVMQFMLTAGLGGEKSNRAAAMTYTHMLFAAGFDKWVFGHQMGAISLVGCGFIIGSALWVALTKREPEKRSESDPEAVDVAGIGIEQIPMLAGDEDEEEEEGEHIPVAPLR